MTTLRNKKSVVNLAIILVSAGVVATSAAAPVRKPRPRIVAAVMVDTDQRGDEAVDPVRDLVADRAHLVDREAVGSEMPQFS